ncbi:AAA family ATPase [Lentzea sp. NPDC060358]|uniref:AAA family ATPase n=1 Tax=Lentzea sp. NPDC060358 TaxID=3347103 RepID=UPI00364F58C7
MTFISQVRLDERHDTRRYPFTLPAVRHLLAHPLELTSPVTFLTGDNGAGKSTLVEAIAVAAGFNAEGGTQSFRFATKATESSLGDHLTLRWGVRKPRTGFFLRAESFYNVITEIDRIGGGIHASYGGRSLHERSHGESFIDLMTHRFGPKGLYVLDEPEAALSVKGCLTVLRRMHELVEAGSQFLVATHSPILLAAPGATILEITDTIDEVSYDTAEPVALTRNFLGEPGRFLRHLLE